jgi:integrase
MAYNKADTTMSRRQYSTGSVYQRSSDGRWFGSIQAGFTANGTRRRITVSGKSKSVVLRRLKDKQLELDRAGAANTRRTITVAKWAQTWLDGIKAHVSPSAYETDKAAVRWITLTIGHLKLTDLTPESVRAIAVAIRKNGGSSSTALRYHGSLIRLLKSAALEGYLIPPNVLLTKKPTAAVSDREPLNIDDCITVLGYLQQRDDAGTLVRPDSSRWSVSLLQGIRQAEALGLTWDEVDLEARTITIQWQVKSLRYLDRQNPAAGFRVPDGYEARHLIGATHLVRPKSRAGWRTIPMIPWVHAALTEWAKVTPANKHRLVWPGRTTKSGTWPRNVATDREQWAEIQTALGIAHPADRTYVVHEIRHTTATLLMELKVPESIRTAILGHSSMASTQIYEHVDPAQILAALGGVGNLLKLEQSGVFVLEAPGDVVPL